MLKKIFHKLPPSERRITLATLFTLARIVLTPCIVYAMINHSWDRACLLFIFAAITDFLDGNLARWRNERTFLGAALDPIADKFLLLSCFSALAFIQSPFFTIPWWLVPLIIIKEFVVLGGACFIYLYKGKLSINPTLLGKATTCVQLGFISWLFVCYFFNWIPGEAFLMVGGCMAGVIILSLL